MAYLFLIGLFIGILIVNLGHEAWIENGSLFGVDMMNRLKNSRPEGAGMIGYILRHRLFTVCMLSLVSTTVIGIPILCAYICYLGLAAGCLLSVAVIRYGIRGILFMAALLMPQAFLLLPAYAGLFLWAVSLNRTLYAPRTDLTGYERFSRRFYLVKCVQIVVILAVVIMGCLLESYVNPNMLRFALKIF
ncbi:MAG: stage II sporulation protein M [Bacteroidales bacterium]|nr:stage II sporulation protein M [Bacteroidales bacterium]MCM1415316.1 stage II sporulation protein M [bacterium]MCM1424403.1 stage II sporulation protein M [bacterium]